MGKTSLARRLVGRARNRGWATHWVPASRAAAAIPLGAFFDVLGDVRLEASSSLTMLQSAAGAIRQRDGDRRVLLTVDDVDLLDATSVTLVSVLVDYPDVTLLLTHRKEQAAANVLDAVDITAEGRTYIDLQPLHRAPARRLAEHTVAAPLTDASFERVWKLSRGYPLFLRELVLAAKEGDSVLVEGGHAVLVGTPTVSARLQEVVELRLASLSRIQRETLELLALHEPVSVEPLTSVCGGRKVLETLEDRQLVTCERVGRRRQARLGHPIYGEVLRHRIPQTRRERLTRALAEALEKVGVRRRGDVLTVARLRLISRTADDPMLLLDAARAARGLFDHRLTEELAAQAGMLGAGVDADLLRGEALANRGAVAMAEEVLAGIGWDDVKESVAAKGALVRAHNLLFASGDALAAQHVIEEALVRVVTDAWRDELEATLALCIGVSGDFGTASAAGTRVSRRPEMGDRAALSVLVVSTLADAMLGRLAAAEEGVRQALPLVPALRNELPFAEAQVSTNRLIIAWHAGQLEKAERLARAYLAEAVKADATDPAALFGLFLSMVSLERGRCREALQFCLASRERAEGRSVFGLDSSALAIQGRAAAGMGNVAMAKEMIDELSQHSSDVRVLVHGVRARTWLLAAEGKLSQAARIAASDGMKAVETSHVVWGAFAMYDAVRCRRPELVAAQLASIANEVEGELVRTIAAHAHAAVHHDGHGLERVALALARMGAHGYAAEAAAHAAAAHVRRSRKGLARRCAAFARTQARRCQGDGFPLIALADEPLTHREHEIARLAARGATSRDIAKLLVISVRTVDNHLSSVYRKTGVAGRHELASTLGIAEAALE